MHTMRLDIENISHFAGMQFFLVFVVGLQLSRDFFFYGGNIAGASLAGSMLQCAYNKCFEEGFLVLSDIWFLNIESYIPKIFEGDI